MSNGFTEAEKIAAQWSKLNKVFDQGQYASKDWRGNTKNTENKYDNSSKYDKKYTLHDNDHEKRQKPRRNDEVTSDFDIFGRDTSKRTTKIIKDRSTDEYKPRERTHSRSRSRSHSRERSHSRKKTGNNWSHDKFDPHENIREIKPVPFDYRPPSPTWKSRAGGVAIMRREKN